ncbi:hypothetical protein TNCT_726701 [Trichonephila clavata]|uniref:Uncharacterized protein n=1 Tax=Trichonephila clavata TaxID=2740835 RepID=A0A8X6H2J6_TRICU|nr:hypothetical protein TNCT_726701 [Trichonephila clavata]
MILQKMTLSLMAVPTALMTCYQCLVGVGNLAFSEILKNIEQFMYYLTLQVSAEKERQQLEAQKVMKLILGSIIRLRTTSEKVVEQQHYLEPLVYSMYYDQRDLLKNFKSLMKARIMLEFVSSLSNIVHSMAWRIYIIIRRFENK